MCEVLITQKKCGGEDGRRKPRNGGERWFNGESTEHKKSRQHKLAVAKLVASGKESQQ